MSLGYFEEFAKHHKETNKDYQLRRSNSFGHSRYTSKPVVFTSLNTKNVFSGQSPLISSKIIEGNSL